MKKNQIFSTDCGSGIKNFKYVFWIFVLCLWSNWSEIVVLVIMFDLWFGRGFIFESSS